MTPDTLHAYYSLVTRQALGRFERQEGKQGGFTVRLTEAPTKDILRDIRKFQMAQKRYPATSEIHSDIGKQLAPLFAEMARRQQVQS